MKKKPRTDSRRKGKAGELEFARLVAELSDGKILLNRNLDQTRDAGQDDLHGLDDFSIEVKRHKRFTDSELNNYWQEAVNQAGDKWPVLAYRQDMQQWRVMVHGNKPGFDLNDIDGTITMSIPMFCHLVSESGDHGLH